VGQTIAYRRRGGGNHFSLFLGHSLLKTSQSLHPPGFTLIFPCISFVKSKKGRKPRCLRRRSVPLNLWPTPPSPCFAPPHGGGLPRLVWEREEEGWEVRDPLPQRGAKHPPPSPPGGGGGSRAQSQSFTPRGENNVILKELYGVGIPS